MIYPFEQTPLLMQHDSNHLIFQPTKPKKSSSEPTLFVHESLCPLNPFLYNKSKFLDCLCSRVDAKGMELMKELYKKLDEEYKSTSPPKHSIFSTDDSDTLSAEKEPQGKKVIKTTMILSIGSPPVDAHFKKIKSSKNSSKAFLGIHWSKRSRPKEATFG